RPAPLRPLGAARRWRRLNPTGLPIVISAAGVSPDVVCTRELNVSLAWPPSSAAERLERDGKRRDAGFGGCVLQTARPRWHCRECRIGAGRLRGAAPARRA